MENVKKYYQRDFTNSITSGVYKILPIELPFVELKRGEYQFSVNGSVYELFAGNFDKELHNSRGGTYTQKQKCYGIRLVSGKDKYELEVAAGERLSSKTSAADYINSTIKNSVYALAKEYRPEAYSIQDFVDEYEKKTIEDKLLIKEHQVEYLLRGHNKNDSFAMAFGYHNTNEMSEKRYVDRDIMERTRRVSIPRLKNRRTD